MVIEPKNIQHLTPVLQKSFLNATITAMQTNVTALQAKVDGGNKEAAGTLNDAKLELAAQQYWLRQLK